MKITFIGGGSLRLLGILRGVLAEHAILQGGELFLYDLNVDRARAMELMIRKTPEYAAIGCTIRSDATLEESLDGADMVGVILMAGSDRTFQLGAHACLENGFVPSDNVSPNGAFLAIKGAPILLNIARKMERHCPDAWLVDFANPIAVLTGMISNHTRIKTLGVCAGYTNHQWDLSRMLGKDEQGTGIDVDVAGVNHLSFILSGTVKGKDLFKTLNRKLTDGWKMPPLASHWSATLQKGIPRGIAKMIRIYHQLGLLIFSSEPDGMMHLDYASELKDQLKTFKPMSADQMQRQLEKYRAGRALADQQFAEALDSDLGPQFWKTGWQKPGYDWAQRQVRDIFVEVLRGLAGVKKIKAVVTRTNAGAVTGFSDRTVLEYSTIIGNGKISAAGHYEIPPVAQGLIASLAAHQTLLADALAENDPKLLAQALLCYPVHSFSAQARKLYRDLAKINLIEMPEPLRSVIDFL